MVETMPPDKLGWQGVSGEIVLCAVVTADAFNVYFTTLLSFPALHQQNFDAHQHI